MDIELYSACEVGILLCSFVQHCWRDESAAQPRQAAGRGHGH